MHQYRLKINGYVSTNKGVKLDYKFLDKEEIKKLNIPKYKFTKKQVETVLGYKNSPVGRRYLLDKLKDKHGIEMSEPTLLRIFKGEYYK